MDGPPSRAGRFAKDVGEALIGKDAASVEADQTARSIAEWAKDP